MTKPFYQDNHVTLWNKSCTDMSELPDNSIQCVVTSPPYWGLRKYSGDQDLIWGNHSGCEHKWVENIISGEIRNNKNNTTHGDSVNNEDDNSFSPRRTGSITKVSYNQPFCSKCGAWRGAYGLEPTVDCYVQHSIEILREIRRVLRKDGVCFWNIGDSYASGGKSGEGEIRTISENLHASANDPSLNCQRRAPLSQGLKPKDLCLIPFRVALAAQADGWWVRSVIIWNKNNPMPESVTDRPTESHEYILILTKSANYYWDQEAVREPLIPHSGNNGAKSARTFSKTTGEVSGERTDPSRFEPMRSNPYGRNLRSVWTFSTQPYPEAHFATFPEKLPELCIKAATPEYGCCDKCGTPWERVIEKGLTAHDGKTNSKSDPAEKGNAGAYGRLAQLRQAARERGGEYVNESQTLGWLQACKCQDSNHVPSTVLDCFAGSGTTLWVAKKLGRKSIGYELSEEYCNLIIERNRQQVLGANPMSRILNDTKMREG